MIYEIGYGLRLRWPGGTSTYLSLYILGTHLIAGRAGRTIPNIDALALKCAWQVYLGALSLFCDPPFSEYMWGDDLPRARHPRMSTPSVCCKVKQV